MKRKKFERELDKRLEENKRLTGKPFLPGVFFPASSFVATHLFWVMLIVSFLITLVIFGGAQEKLLGLSKLLLLLTR